MAPLSRSVHLIGMGLFAIVYGLVRATLSSASVAAMFALHMPDANFGTAILSCSRSRRSRSSGSG